MHNRIEYTDMHSKVGFWRRRLGSIFWVFTRALAIGNGRSLQMPKSALPPCQKTTFECISVYMKNREPVLAGLDLNDATFNSLSIKEDMLFVDLELWNEKKISICFHDILKFTFNSPDFLGELNYVSLPSEFMNDALSHRYAQIPSEPTQNFPKDHPYNHYQMLDINGHVVLEIIAAKATYAVAQ